MWEGENQDEFKAAAGHVAWCGRGSWVYWMGRRKGRVCIQDVGLAGRACMGRGKGRRMGVAPLSDWPSGADLPPG